MCTGTSLFIPKVIIGVNVTFQGAEQLFLDRGVELINLNDKKCIAMMTEFISTFPELWNEDIGIPPQTNAIE